MDHNVDDYLGSYYPQPLQPKREADGLNESNNKDEEPPTTIISRIRSLFSQTAECNDFDYSDQAPVPIANIPSQLSDHAFLDMHKRAGYSSDPNNFLDVDVDMTDDAGTMTPAYHHFSDVGRIMTSFAAPASATGHTTPHSHARIDSDSSSVAGSGSGQSDFSHSHSASSALTSANTPPLTPDSFNGFLLSPSSFSSGISEQFQHANSHQQQFRNSLQPGIQIHEDQAQYISHSQDMPGQYQYLNSHHQRYQNSFQPGIQIHEEDNSQHIRDIKEGKKQQRPIVRVWAPPHN
jgi:hypothetical protein